MRSGTMQALGGGLVRAPAIRRMFAEHLAGRKNHAMHLWTLWVLDNGSGGTSHCFPLIHATTVDMHS